MVRHEGLGWSVVSWLEESRARLPEAREISLKSFVFEIYAQFAFYSIVCPFFKYEMMLEITHL